MNIVASYIALLKSISRPAKLYMLNTILYWTGMTLVQLYLNFFLQGMGLDQGWIGLINATPQLTTVVMTLVIGSMSAKMGPWLSTMVGVVLAGLGIFAMVFAPDAWTVFGASVLNGLGGGFVWANSGPFMMLHSEPRSRATLFSLQSALGTLTGFVGFLGGGMLPGIISPMLGKPATSADVLRITLLVASVFYLLSIVPVYFARSRHTAVAVEEPAGRQPTESTPSGLFRLGITNWPLTLRLIVPGSVTGIGAGMCIPFLNIFIEGKFNVSFEGLGQIFAWSSVATALALMVQPVLADRLGKVRSVLIVQGLSLPFLVILGYSPVFPLVVAALFVRGALMNMGNPVFGAYSMERIPERERASFSALSSSLWALGWSFGSWSSGAIRDAIGFAAGFNILFALMTLTYSASMVMMWLWFVPSESAERKRAEAAEQATVRVA